MQPRVLILLRRCLFDNDDEVRDRATLYLNVLGGDGAEISVAGDEEDGAKKFMLEELDVPLQNLETALKAYVSPFLLLEVDVSRGSHGLPPGYAWDTGSSSPCHDAVLQCPLFYLLAMKCLFESPSYVCMVCIVRVLLGLRPDFAGAE